MARDWEDLAGEKGQVVPSGRLKRLFKMGSLGVSMSASVVAQKMAGFVSGQKEGDDPLSALRAKHADKVVKVLGELKGASMKLGQILSADPDLVPAEYGDALRVLQRSAPPMTWATIQAQVERAFDQPISAVYRFFDPEPIGSASIGQVHRATLMSGEDVAVKIQYPGVLESLEADLKNLGSLLTLGRAFVDKRRLDEYLAECRKAVIEEADYELEARNLRRFHELLQDREGLRAPRPYEEWTRPTVLTMELVHGTKLDEAVAAMDDGPRRQALLERWVRAYVWMFHELFQLHADPHPGNFLVDADDTLVMLDFGCVKACDPTFADGILSVMDACWQRDAQRVARLYRELGFGKAGEREDAFDPELLRQYHDMLLAPFLLDREFDFGAWGLRDQMQRFMLRHPRFIRMVPPAEAVLVARVMSGIKGLLARSGAKLNVHRIALETAERRGVLTGPPTYR